MELNINYFLPRKIAFVQIKKTAVWVYSCSVCCSIFSNGNFKAL